jgi:hypothetical protein
MRMIWSSLEEVPSRFAAGTSHHLEAITGDGRCKEIVGRGAINWLGVG